jgi:lysyl-tRNA synthetase class 2
VTGAAATGKPRVRLAVLRQAYLRRAPGIIATIAALIGLLTLVKVAVPSQRDHLDDFTPMIPVPASVAAAAVTTVSALLLLRLGAGLRKRKAYACRLAIGATAALVLTHVLKGHPAQAAPALLLFVLLLSARSRFTAKSDPATRRAVVRVFGQLITVALAYGLAMLYLYPDQLDGNPSFWARLQEVLYGLVGARGPLQLHGERFSAVVHGTLLGFGLLTAAVVALLLLRPAEPDGLLRAADEQQLRGLLAIHGARDSLGYFATRRDKSVVWSASGKAAISYRVVQGVALASGDPIGDAEAWPGAIAAFGELSQDYAWTPAVMGCSELGATVFKRELGLAALNLGDEAIVQVADFALTGRPMRGVRQACARVERAGYEVQVRRARSIGPVEFRELRAAATAWRGSGVERGFSMALSRLADPFDGDCVVVTAYSDGVLRGLLHFVPWGADGLSLDLMRRDRASDNGLNEFLIVGLLQACPSLGVQRVSLNFAAFREALERGERIGAGPVLRLWRRVLLAGSRWWQIESLYRFNAKFQPTWQPRFLSFPATRDLPRIVIAALEAEAFLARPRVVKRLLHRDERSWSGTRKVAG